MKFKTLLLGAVTLFIAAHAPGHAQTASTPAAVPVIPVETLFKKTQYRSLSFSPDRKFMAALMPMPQMNDRYNVVVLDLEKRAANVITAFRDTDARSVSWANNDRLLITTGNEQGFEARGDGGLFAVDRDGKNARTLVEPFRATAGQYVARITTPIARIRDNNQEMLVSANDRSADSQDLYRMNIQTGRKTLISVDSPGNVSRWVLDRDLTPRAALSVDLEKRRYWFSYRDKNETKYRVMAEWDEQLKNVIQPVGFATFKGEESMIVASNVGRDTMAFFRFDLKTGKLGEMIFGDDRYDVATPALIGSGSTGTILTGAEAAGEETKILGVVLNADRPRRILFDEEAKKLQAMVDGALPAGRWNSFSYTGNPVLVTSISDTQPAEYYILDKEKKTIEDTGLRAAPWIDPKQMAPMQYVTWTAPDGMKISGYLTLPLSYKKGQRVPLIVHPHGGPWVRDSWGFNREVQFMANRGFAVLQPNFRGSTGYGINHLKASYKQWGGTMIDDMIAGAEWAIKEGIADPNRIAAYGASYGGYSTLMMLVKRPDLFKWGVNYVGVTDMEVHQDTQPAQRLGDFANLAKIINGDQRADRAMFEATSPTKQVGKIAVPVFHAYGGEDRNVDMANGRAIRSAFDRANKPYEWMFVADEAHGYRIDKNVFEFYNRFDAFMKKHTPPAK